MPREQHAGLFAIINKARMLNGWTTRTAQDLDPTIRSWAELFAVYKIPISNYQELYQRAFDVRQTRTRQGSEVPQMDATLIVSQWTGTHGLRAEIEQRRIDAGNILPDVAKSQCQRCFGTGIETIFGPDGRSLGARPGCKHETTTAKQGAAL